MAEDTRNYIEKQIDRSRAIAGSEPSPDSLAKEFMKIDLNERLDVLDALSRDLASDGEMTLQEAVGMGRYVRALRGTHEALRKAGR